jgi:hypothetical protein
MTTTTTTTVTPQAVAQVLAQIVTLEPKIATYAQELGPLTASLPTPWNLLSNPIVQEAFTVFPTLLPILTQIETILNSLTPPPAEPAPPAA